ncbi:translation initiation factor IF-2 [Geotoga petraea]|uniref:Translation initiation factor IF-2 n=1 Tax=Geotoga petraea TaxID=28234 RepID=A0A1G6QM27_9BACT|nr:translation initiation factor IF-2 [Geotoga petraea]TGG86690.1 translation initiation factor IF-2 [Geotoga petraea]SDC93281.1 bacterial translation initiation factor 2 (bIF-2) [Geotoga petraea]
MPKIRVYELAKKLDYNSKDLVEILKNELDIDVKSHMSTLEQDTVEAIEDLLAPSKNKEEKAKKSEKSKKQEKSKKKKAAPKSEQQNKKEEPVEKEEEKQSIGEINLTPSELTLDKIAKKLSVDQNDIIKKAFMEGKMLRPGQELSPTETEEIGLLYETVINFVEEEKKEEELDNELVDYWNKVYEEQKDSLKTRPPVVTVMGHVDHGKTTLLDNIRNTKVAEGEEGGITQSIGAYQLEYNDKKITFIDTPGHEAFTEMRARGAQATDIVVLIIAADDGVMPQTIEAYNHAKDAKVPVIVAINKIDKPNANVELTKQQMVAKLNLIPEDWGGDTITVPISAISKEGIDELLEMISLVSEMEEIKCKPNGQARAVIIESKLDKFLGPVATVIVKDGILKTGDYFIAGSTYGKVRRMIDDQGRTIKKALPSTPVQVLGFNEVADTHSILYVTNSLNQAREISGKKKEKEDLANQNINKKHVKLEDFMKMMEGNQKKVLNIILKAGTFGEIEALKNSINKLQNPDIDIDIVHAGIGTVTTSDIMLASASDAVVMGFRVKVDNKAKKDAEKEGIQIKRYDIIFQLIDELKKALQGMLELEEKEENTGSGKIKEVFKIKKVGNVAGVIVEDGYVERDGGVRIYRNGSLLQDVKIESLKHYKDEVKRIEAPQEGGIKFENFDDFNAGDELEFYKNIQFERQIEFDNSKDR